MARKPVTKKSMNYAIDETLRKLVYRIEQKGGRSYSSNHEALGIITEEYYELIDAVKSNNNEHVKEELLDVAVGCLFAIASMKQKEKIQ